MDNFSDLFDTKIVLMFEKTENKWKRGQKCPILKKHVRFVLSMSIVLGSIVNKTEMG